MSVRRGDGIVLVTGDARPITKFYSDGLECPWCFHAHGDDEECPNPACVASPWSTAEAVRQTLAEQAAGAVERDRREREVASLAAAFAERQSAAARRRAEVETEAERRGACLICLRKSDYNAPRFITHRRANFHGGAA
jgi:GAF domain-containing protein